MSKFSSDTTYKDLNFSEKELLEEYDNCTFLNCIFNDASSVVFEDCTFNSCDFSNCKVDNTSFKEVTFKGCKLLGVLFTHCNPFLLDFDFSECNLQFASFYNLTIPKTTFNNCKIIKTDFTECSLKESRFNSCDLSGSIFENTNLEKCNFTTAYNFKINPTNNKVNKARFSKGNSFGLLDSFNIIID